MGPTELLTADVPRIMRALEDLGLASPRTMIAVDDGRAVLPWHDRGIAG